MRGHQGNVDVVFISMPFGPRHQPSLALSLLKAALTSAGHDSQVRYFTLDFAREIGGGVYDAVCQGSPTTPAGEWIFASSLFGDVPDGAAAFLRTCVTEPEFAEQLLNARMRASDFLERAQDEILTLRPQIVGFSSSFQQHVASLSLARLLKQSRPELRIIFGGANCEAVMGAETIRRFAFVDAVVSGEADSVIVDLVRRLLRQESIDDINGVYTRANLNGVELDGYPTGGPVLEMDALPYPDCADYFDQLAELQDSSNDTRPRLLLEMSRGCWWGEKHHCTFCGLNGTTLQFRRKSAERGIAELEHLVQKYGVRAVEFVDNILDMRYFNDFIPALIKRNLGLELFFEIKANLKKEQLLMLRAAGARAVQPGIESLNSSVLALMDKGVRGLQNVQLLKWCRELGMLPHWNVIWGFPDEKESDYTVLAEQIPHLSHLTPPGHAGLLRLDRFSPNFDDAHARGLRQVRPHDAYRYVYDLPEPAIANLAYYFTFTYADARKPDSYTEALSRAIRHWREDHSCSELISVDCDGSLLIIDCRPKVGPAVRTLAGLDRILYLQCDTATAITRLIELAAEHGESLKREDLERRLEPLLRSGLMMREGNMYLSLAIPVGDFVPRGEIRERLMTLSSLPAVETLATSRV